MPILNKKKRQLINRQLVTCQHGVGSDETCWWCESLGNKPITKKIEILEGRFDALLGVVLMILKTRTPTRTVLGGSVNTVINQIVEEGLIKSGNDADKPNSNTIAFWYATDTDRIYQRRDNDWIDISYSRPVSPDLRISDISVDDTTGTVEVTHQ